MASERWQELEDLFLELRETAEEGRQVILREVSSRDPALADEVRDLLAAEAGAEGFLGSPWGLSGALSAGEPDPRKEVPLPREIRRGDPGSRRKPPPGEYLGPYRILRRLGSGGTSTVYLGERADRSYEQRVAIKVIGREMWTPGAAERFQAERQILASLSHPNIARLLDGGAIADGRPYLVLELVEGEPIDRYCDGKRLPLGDRLELFSKVLAAVGAAHRSLVVHRDLKPGNILVDGAGEPKLLDFGIAKLLQPDLLPVAVPSTAAWVRLLTPRYASPEQLRGERVTTASDVYSLGLLLYELVAGRSPWPSATTAPALLELRSDAAPPPPSEALAGQTADRRIEAESIAEARSEHPKALWRLLKGDLDAVVLKALEPEPDRRYASVELLREDLERYRGGFPVTARPVGWTQRSRRFLGRHRWAASLTAGLLAVVFSLSGIAVHQSLRLAAERDEALAARQRSEEVVAFLQDVFRVAVEGEELTVRQAVSRSAASLETKLLEQPRVRADLLEVIGNIYRHLGVYDEAERQLAKAVGIRRELFGADSVAVARALGALGSVQAWQNRLDEGEGKARRALAILEQGEEEDPRVRTALLNELVGLLCLRGDFADAEEPSRAAANLAAARLEDRDVEKARALASRARVLSGTGRNGEALALYREAVRLQRYSQGAEHPEVAILLNNLALAYRQEGQLGEARDRLREAIRLQRKLSGDRGPNVALLLKNLGDLHLALGELDAAEGSYGESRRIIEAAFGPDHYAVLVNLAGMASVRLRQGRPGEAQSLVEDWFETWGEDLKSPYLRGLGESVLGEALTAQGRFAEAEPLLARSYRAILASQGEDSEKTREALRRLSEHYRSRGAEPPPP